MAERKRFFVDSVGDTAELTGEEFEHAKNVLRISVGAEVVLLDNSGKEYTAVVTSVEKRRMALHIVREEVGEREAETDICLLFGYLKNADKNEFIVQKAVELGVNEIGVFTSEFSSAYINENKLERLNRVAKEAAKQCLRSRAPIVKYHADFSSALNATNGYQNKIFACEFAQKSDLELGKISGSTALIVGSEGGFSNAEAEQAVASGCKQVTLGKRILRAETAAVALTAVVAYALGEWQR